MLALYLIKTVGAKKGSHIIVSPLCLGVSFRGEGQGLRPFQVIKTQFAPGIKNCGT
jgi:hypothetical protein